MSAEFMRKVASVLEQIAEQYGHTEQQQREVVRAEKQQVTKALGEKFAAATGEELPAPALERLANSDRELLQVFEKLTKTAAAPDPDKDTREPDEMGEAVDADNERVRQTTKTASEDADKRFLSWIMD